MKKYLILWLIIFPLVFSGCFDSEDEIVAEYEYRIEITPLNDTGFIVYIPFPIDIKNNDEPSTIILDNLKLISGNAEFNLNETNKEIALKVVSTENIILESKGNFQNKDDMPTFLSLHELDENGKRKECGITNFWIYSNTNGSIRIKYHLKENSNPYLFIEYEINGGFTYGWNLVQGDIKSEVA